MKRRWEEEIARRYRRLFPPSSASRNAAAEMEANSAAAAAGGGERAVERKPGGWKTMPYIIGNETFERVASFGMTTNLTVYLVKRYHMGTVAAANLTNIWNGTTNFAPLLGAFVSDAYWGKFNTLVFACVATFLVRRLAFHTPVRRHQGGRGLV
ncbi:hypothetical protein Taro_052558 [Colocasia esculenta]|uniref:Uncharacterized protein n=1 Tax=Colocasia esculenta TaxID=4460 RepID=A0A843XK42_COLES|nr:hypothetical protein [Colocasia esculenta]